MTKGSKAIIIICLCFSVVLMGLGIYLIVTPDTSVPVQQNPQGNVIQNVDPNNNQYVNNGQVTPQQQTPVVTNPNTPAVTNPSQGGVNTNPVTPDNGNTQQTPNAGADVSSMSTQQILDMMTTAVNNTKASTANCKVHHSEGIDINITDCPGGSLVKNVITPIISKFAAPTEEDINFVGGRGTNSEGAAVTLASFPPVDKQFTLTSAGVASATAQSVNGNTVLTVKLVPETVTSPTAVPQHNAASIGYLDLGSIDLGNSITINGGNFQYPGSTVTATVNSNGQLLNVKYNLPMVVSIDGKVVAFTGTVGFTGEQNEEWTFNW